MLNRMKTKLKLLKISGLTPRMQSGETTQNKKHNYELNFRGDRYDEHPITRQMKMGSHRQSSEYRYKDSLDQYQMLPRKTRLKASLQMLFYIIWYLGMAVFIMKRVGGNDIDELEKEAYERLKIIESSKDM